MVLLRDRAYKERLQSKEMASAVKLGTRKNGKEKEKKTNKRQQFVVQRTQFRNTSFNYLIQAERVDCDDY